MDPAYEKLTQPERDAQNRLVLDEMYNYLFKASALILFLSPELKGDIEKAIQGARVAVLGPKSKLENR